MTHTEQRHILLGRARSYCDRIEAGETIAQIAKAESLSPERIRQVAGLFRPRKAPAEIWPEERIQDLRNDWTDGYTTAQIGKRIGVSKNAVVGKVHRLGLPPRPSPIVRMTSAAR